MINDKSYRVPKKDFENILKIYGDFYFGSSQFFPSYCGGKMNPVNYTKEVKNNYSKCHQSILDTL